MKQALQKTIKNVKEHYLMLAASSVLDIIFFYLLTRLHVEIFKKAATHIKETQKIIESQMTKLTQTQYAQMDKLLMDNSNFAYQYHEILKYIGIFLLGLFAIWFVLRGANWLLAHKIANSKIGLKEFAKRFSILSIAGFALLILTLIAYSAMLNYTAFNPLPLINTKIANTLFAILLITLQYFITAGFAMPHNTKPKEFIKIITKAKKILPVFITNNVIIAVLIIIPALLMRNYYWAGLLTSIIITIPTMTVARVFLINVITEK